LLPRLDRDRDRLPGGADRDRRNLVDAAENLHSRIGREHVYQLPAARPMKRKNISTDQLELYEACILSEQIAHSEIVELLADIPSSRRGSKRERR
jgi:hypothetical protein